jgi:hypothetical protein
MGAWRSHAMPLLELIERVSLARHVGELKLRAVGYEDAGSLAPALNPAARDSRHVQLLVVAVLHPYGQKTRTRLCGRPGDSEG